MILLISLFSHIDSVLVRTLEHNLFLHSRCQHKLKANMPRLNFVVFLISGHKRNQNFITQLFAIVQDPNADNLCKNKK